MRGAFCISLELRKRGGIIGLFVLRFCLCFLLYLFEGHFSTLKNRRSSVNDIGHEARHTTHEKGKGCTNSYPAFLFFMMGRLFFFLIFAGLWVRRGGGIYCFLFACLVVS